MTRILTAREIESLISLDECIDAVDRAFRDLGEGRSAKPYTLGVHGDNGTFHVKCAATDLFVAKLNANFPSNPKRFGLPTVQGLIAVMDLERGTPLAIFDSAAVTTLRTAAATAVAAKLLSRQNAHTLAVIGCGVQGAATIDAISRVRAISRIRLFDADPQRSAELARARESAVTCGSIDEALRGADIVVTCTPSHEPILHRAHARPGVFIAAVGADNPQKNEIAPDLMASARVVPDVVEQAATMGDLHHAIERGAMRAEDVHAELSAIVCGRAPARTAEDEVFVFDSTGTALQDAVVASIILRRAIESHVGIDVSFAR